MKLYLDVGVTRIQEYIGRTAGADEGQLRRRRGASRMVTNATDAGNFAVLGWQPNDETYTAEGVAHLVRPMAAPTQAECGIGLVEQVLIRLREALPHAYLEASWARAETYAEALNRLESARRLLGTPSLNMPDGRGALAWLPPVREDPYASRCGSCGLAAAESAVTDRKSQPQCDDCILRDSQGRPAGARGPVGADRQTPEEQTLAAVSELVDAPLRPVRDLNQLGRLPRRAVEKKNHIATIYADGNNVGALFEGLSPAQATRVSKALDASIKHAGRFALAQIHPSCDPAYLPGVVTTLAADDVLITVPASCGWAFAIHLVDAFNEEMASAMSREMRDSDLGAAPTLTAGVVFSHYKHPIEDAINAAETVMRSAKKATNGAAAAIGWADLTQTGTSEHSPSRPLQWFAGNRGLIDHVAGLAASQRQKWMRDISTAIQEHVPDETITGFLSDEARRLGLRAPGLEQLPLDDVIALLQIVRWWTPPSPGVGVSSPASHDRLEVS
ncbi:MAG: hypothetical protein L0H25_01760 [Micrococcales bacterium]|nr:hypothetical protein [Micrococcales bacterium]